MAKKKTVNKRPFVTDKTITMRNNAITIRPFQPGGRGIPYSGIEMVTSLFDPVTHKRTPINGFPLETNDGTGECLFATCKQSVSYLMSKYPDYAIIDEPLWNSNSMISETIQTTEDFIPSDIQLDIISRYSALKNKSDVYINMPTGSGKTLLGIYLACSYGKRLLVVCYKTDVLKQWKESFETFTTISPDQVEIVSSSKRFLSMYEENKKPDYIYVGPSVILCTTSLLRNLIEKLPIDEFSDMIRSFGFGMMVIDEAHRHLANIIKINALTNIRRTLYISAEFRRANSAMDKYFFSMFHTTNVLRPADELAESFKYTVGVIVEYNSYPDTIEHDSCFGNRGFQEFNYMRYQLEKGVFLEVLDKLIEMIINKNDGMKIILFTDLVEQVDFLYERYVRKYGNVRHMTRLYSGVEADERERVSSADFIVSTYKSLDTGTDIKNIKHIISTVPVDIICDNQAAGRSRPLPDGSLAFYYILSDVGFPYIKKKTKRRVDSLFEQKLVDCYKLKL